MAIFTSDEANEQHRDCAILRDGGVALYWRPEALKTDLNWLESNGYNIIEFDASRWNSAEQMHDSLRSALSFPYYYGRNLDALDECMCDDVAVPDTGGVALVFNHYDHFASLDRAGDPNEKPLAESVLRILARAVRYHMLFGRRLLILLQSDDPRIRFDDLAGISASWNPRE
jgi:RNAse (barnase) inhibitor barstar